jgi:hypothetical protein
MPPAPAVAAVLTETICPSKDTELYLRTVHAFESTTIRSRGLNQKRLAILSRILVTAEKNWTENRDDSHLRQRSQRRYPAGRPGVRSH